MDSQPQLLTSCRCFSIMHSLQAVCETLKVSPVAAAAGLTVDNVMALLYFPLCDFLGRNDKDPEQQQQQSATPAKSAESELEPVAAEESSASRGESVSDLSAALAVAVCVVAAAEKAFPAYSVVASTLLTVCSRRRFLGCWGPSARRAPSSARSSSTSSSPPPERRGRPRRDSRRHRTVAAGLPGGAGRPPERSARRGSRWRLGRRSLGLGFLAPLS